MVNVPDNGLSSSHVLTASQREIWVGQQLNPLSPLYNMAMACTIRSKLNVQNFSKAWEQLQNETFSLRARVCNNGMEPILKYDSAAVPLSIIDCSKEPNPESTAHALLQKNAATAMNISNSMVQTQLIKLHEGQWIWLLNQHHLVTDATSFTFLWNRIASLYESLQQSAHLPQAPDQVLETTTPPDSETATHWQDMTLPPAVRIYGGAESGTSTHSSRIPADNHRELATALSALAQTAQVRTFSKHLGQYQLLLTALFAFMHRTTGQSRLAIGSPVAHRSTASARTAPSLHMEVMPVCMSIEPNETFSSLLDKVRSGVHELLTYSKPGCCALISGRELSVILNYVTTSINPIDNLPVHVDWIHSGHADRNHVLRLHATDWQSEDTLSLDMDFNNSCFTPAQQSQAVKHWQSLLRAMLQNMDTSIQSITLAPSKQKKIFTEKPDTISMAKARNTTILDYLDSVSIRCADKPAVVQERSSLTYEQLLKQAKHISAELRSLSIGKQDRVAICMQRNIRLPACLIGILQSGAAYVPIEPEFPTDRIRTILNDANPAALIIDSTMRGLTKLGLQLPIVEIKGDSAQLELLVHRNQNNKLIAGEGIQKPEVDILEIARPAAVDTAYCLYTSGSTGTPKAVVISHAALLNYCTWATEHYTAGKAQNFPFFTPLGFDLTVTSLFVPLLSGGQIHVYPPQDAKIDNALSRVLADNKVDIIKLTPAHLATLQHRNLHSSKVSQLIVGGDDLKCSICQSVTQAFGGNLVIHNEYGPTEATVGCIVHQFDSEHDVFGSVPIGHPVAGMSVHVLNESGQQQAHGVAGELYLSGPSLADGYWQQQTLSNQQFQIPPDGSSGRRYRTGDLVRYNPKGQLVYLGRQDHQVKIRGARVELAEIEAMALSHPAISETLVIVDSSHIPSSDSNKKEHFCVRCGLSSSYPDAQLDEDDVCSLCEGFEQYSHRARDYFRSMPELEKIATNIRHINNSSYDCMMLLSGGKDSTYALAKLVDLKLSVLAFTLDNGFLSNEAMANITRVCNALGVDHEFGKTPAMPQIFVDSLKRYSNVCNGCFKTIYTLSMQRAEQLEIPYIFTGLSRGQFFETRLTETLFTQPDTNLSDIDEMVLSARKAYHRTPDAVSELLETAHFDNDDIFEKVRFIDFYRYCPVDLDEMLNYLQNRLPWVRPADTGRSTNCLINDVGIYFHKRTRGFHNYALPYSWDVRLGHKQRDEALEELDDDIDQTHVFNVLDQIGFPIKELESADDARLVLYYTVQGDVTISELKQWLSQQLPAWSMPSWFMPLGNFPLSPNGKIERNKLPSPRANRELAQTDYVAPAGALQCSLAELWCKHLKLNRVGIHDNFFELGGDSLQAIRIATQINQQGFAFQTSDLFEYQTIASLTELTRNKQPEPTMAQGKPVERTAETAPPTAFSQLDKSQLSKLVRVLKTS